MTVDPQNSISNAAQSSRQRYLEIAIVFLVFFVFGGVPVPHVNETHYLTKAKHYWNPQWCAGDLFLESADAHLTFYWTVGLLTKWFSLPTVAWLGRILAWAMLAWSWQRLSRRIVCVPWVAVITAMLLVMLIEYTNLAGEWVVGGIEGKCFAYVFVFWGLSELAVGNWRSLWPLLGLAGAFHVLVGGWSVICAGIVWLLQPRETRPTLSKMAPPILLGGMLALPGILPGLLLTRNASPEIRDEANQIYVFERLPHHLALHRLPPEEIIARFRRFGLLLIGFVGLSRYRFEKGKSDNDALGRIQQFAWASVAISLVGLVWEFATINYPALSASVLKYYWFRLADVAVPLAVALSLGWLVKSAARTRKRFAVIVVALTIAIPSYLLVDFAIVRWNAVQTTDTYEARREFGWLDACEWVRDHTDPDALFLVPRRGSTFRWIAERPVFFTWKDVPQDAESLVNWWQRYLEAYYGAVDELGETKAYGSLQELGADRIHDLAEKHRIDYVLTTEYPPLPLPVAYENPWYKIYDLRSLTERE